MSSVNPGKEEKEPGLINRGQVKKMKKPLKYILLCTAAVGILVVAAVVILSTLVDVQSYKPRIEQLVTEKTGYPLTLGGTMSLSLFPWVGLGFTDLKLDNPAGFSAKTFITIESFQARLKVLPLLSRKIEISSFVVKRPEIFLEKNPKGTWNWEKLEQSGKPSTAATEKQAPVPATDNNKQQPAPDKKFALQSLMVGEFSITDGRVQINDTVNKLQREVANFTLQLDDVSLDKPIKINMAASLDGKPIKLEGAVGPVGPDPGAGKINLDLTMQALEILNIQASGSLEDIQQKIRYALAVNIQPFSPKKLFATLGLRFPIITADPQVLENLGMKAKFVGGAGQLVLSDGHLLFDDSVVTLDMTAKDFSRPDLALKMAVDTIDLDRYLPAAEADKKATPEQGKAATAQGQGAVSAVSEKKPLEQAKKDSGIDYQPFRKLALQATLKLGEMKMHGGSLRNLALDVIGQNGLYTINSLGMELYEGKIAGTGKINVQKNLPATALNLTLQDVQVGPLLTDFASKEIIEGRLKAQVAVSMQGDNGELIKRSLNGKGDLRFQDGALIGLDLAQMARTIKAGFTLEQQQGEKPKTDFAELHAPFTITNGLVNTPETTLRSPFIRVAVTGDANLVSEALDMRIKPAIVGSIKGQGDEEKLAGLTVPVVVGGTFKAPKFTPDLESLVKDQMPTEKEIIEIIKTGKVPRERQEKFKEDVEQAKGLLKGLFGN